MYTTDINTQNNAEVKWEISQKIDQIERRQQECKEMLSKLDALEEELQWQNKQRKELNAYLLEVNNKSKDVRLQQLLLEQEEMLQLENIQEEVMFSECRNEIDGEFLEMEQEKDKLFAELDSVEND